MNLLRLPFWVYFKIATCPCSISKPRRLVTDLLFAKVLPSIDSSEKLSSTLLNAAGARLKQLLKPSDVSALSPLTATWLDGFEATEHFDLSPSKTLNLLVESLRRIATDGNDQFIANELHSVLIAMEDPSS